MSTLSSEILQPTKLSSSAPADGLAKMLESVQRLRSSAGGTKQQQQRPASIGIEFPASATGFEPGDLLTGWGIQSNGDGGGGGGDGGSGAGDAGAGSSGSSSGGPGSGNGGAGAGAGGTVFNNGGVDDGREFNLLGLESPRTSTDGQSGMDGMDPRLFSRARSNADFLLGGVVGGNVSGRDLLSEFDTVHRTATDPFDLAGLNAIDDTKELMSVLGGAAFGAPAPAPEHAASAHSALLGDPVDADADNTDDHDHDDDDDDDEEEGFDDLSYIGHVMSGSGGGGNNAAGAAPAAATVDELAAALSDSEAVLHMLAASGGSGGAAPVVVGGYPTPPAVTPSGADAVGASLYPNLNASASSPSSSSSAAPPSLPSETLAPTRSPRPPRPRAAAASSTKQTPGPLPGYSPTAAATVDDGQPFDSVSPLSPLQPKGKSLVTMGFREDIVRIATKRPDWNDASEDEQITFILAVEGFVTAGFAPKSAIETLERLGGFSPKDLKLCKELISMGFDATEVGNAVKECAGDMGKALDVLGDMTY